MKALENFEMVIHLAPRGRDVKTYRESALEKLRRPTLEELAISHLSSTIDCAKGGAIMDHWGVAAKKLCPLKC